MINNKTIKLAFGARKGGEGKTFLAVNIGAELAMRGYKVLLVGLDSQNCIAQYYLGYLDEEEEKKEYHYDDYTSFEGAARGEYSIREAIYETGELPMYKWLYEADEHTPKTKLNADEQIVRVRKPIYDNSFHLDVIPSGDTLDELDHWYFGSIDKNNPTKIVPNYQSVSSILEELEDDYDFIIMDLPPHATGVVPAACAYADYVISPYTAIESISSWIMMQEIIDGVMENNAHYPDFMIISNKHHRASLAHNERLDSIANNINDNLSRYCLTSKIRYSIEAQKAREDGYPICSWGKSGLTDDIASVTEELLDKWGLPYQIEGDNEGDNV